MEILSKRSEMSQMVVLQMVVLQTFCSEFSDTSVINGRLARPCRCYRPDVDRRDLSGAELEELEKRCGK
jgi:hypothetical protein